MGYCSNAKIDMELVLETESWSLVQRKRILKDIFKNKNNKKGWQCYFGFNKAAL